MRITCQDITQKVIPMENRLLYFHQTNSHCIQSRINEIKLLNNHDKNNCHISLMNKIIFSEYEKHC